MFLVVRVWKGWDRDLVVVRGGFRGFFLGKIRFLILERVIVKWSWSLLEGRCLIWLVVGLIRERGNLGSIV